MTSDGNRKRRSSSSTGKKRTSSARNTSNAKKRNTNTKGNSKAKKKNDEYEFDYVKTLIYIGVFAVLIVMFLFALGIFDGGIGLFITNLIKGLFGFDAFLIPIVGIITVIYYIFTPTTKKTVLNVISAVIFVIAIGLIAHLISYSEISKINYTEAVKIFYHEGKGGGVLIGSIAYLVDKSFARPFVWIISILFIIASVTVMFGKYIVRYTRLLIAKYTDLDDGDDDEDEREYTRREIRKLREKEKLEAQKRKPSYKLIEEEEEEVKPKEKENKVIDVEPSQIRSFFDKDDEEKEEKVKEVKTKKETKDIHQIDAKNIKPSVSNDEIKPINVYNEEVKSVVINRKQDIAPVEAPAIPAAPEPAGLNLTASSVKMLENTAPNNALPSSTDPALDAYKTKSAPKSNKPYQFPPIKLLKKGSSSGKGNGDNIIETANKLKETLATFGVEVSIDPENCSKGPAVTRYELTPAPGVKVSRIVSLSDDIKLSLGAADIRIEAPIPGKSAVGIEVPNSESTAVPFRDLIESKDFEQSKSKISFAVGKDLSGQVVISDIAKMPHLLIAGATGSGKSVCINTVIMSILYKAHPDDVKLILIDPKVVELSVYNGIPHLLLPVVTDPKQASASLHWGVSEMEDRYKKFADANVRDLKGYNEKMASEPDGKKLPQIVIIVDELADLMMVAGKEVEESICRLAQLARAAGIHLIIATQRPSVDVITGLIKANMPSRIAFSVSSGIDSRTILDTNGAEKLLGKGDMLFFPQGMNKPSRVQGCFVSDNEVLDVVDFIKNQNIQGYDERVLETVKSGSTGTVAAPGGDLDDLFGQAGIFIIGKEKASIGALQRAFKIGFNRAARIMDQLEAKGVVGPEEGTKPRKILMSESEFQQMMENQ